MSFDTVTKAADLEQMLADGWHLVPIAGVHGYHLVKDGEVRGVWNNAVRSLVRRGVIGEPT